MNEVLFKQFKKLKTLMPRKLAWSLVECEQANWLNWLRNNTEFQSKENKGEYDRYVFTLKQGNETTTFICNVDVFCPLYQELVVKREFFIIDLF